MAKAKISFECTECGAKFPKWAGKCYTCNAWSSLVEVKPEIAEGKRKGLGSKSSSVLLKDITSESNARMNTGIEEFNRVLGGGLVSGSLVLLGGDPGIGKSTLLLQIMVTLCTADVRSLYITGEESLQQIKLRAKRLNIPSPDLPIMCETNLENILAEAKKLKPQVMVIDSIQTIYNPELSGAPGAEMQLKEAALSLMVYAKTHNCSIILIGHVTKGGAIAGPKVIEHMVDTVVYFEGEKHNTYRMLRCVKNRFGATNEIGVFEMVATGLIEVKNPSSLFVQNIDDRDPGSIITCAQEGSRPLLIEIQALVNKSSFSNAQRVAMGMDSKRLTIILALLEKFAGVEIGDQDVFISVAGGLRIDEPAVDLAIAAAVASNHLGKQSIAKTIAIGELGLNGEVRSISHLDDRIKEAVRLGFTRIVCPTLGKAKRPANVELIPVQKLEQALENIYG